MAPAAKSAALSSAGTGASVIRKQRLRLWLRLLLARRAVEGELRERLRLQFDLTLPQFDVLAALARNADGMTMTSLSQALMVSNGNITGIIDRLTDKHYVARQTVAEDRRRFVVKMTAKGRAEFDVMAKTHEGWVDELLAGIKGEQLDAVMAKLERLAPAPPSPDVTARD